MDNPSIAYAPHPDTKPEAQVSALANIFRFVLDCHAKKEATRPGSPDDGTEVKEDSAYEHRST